MERGIPARSIEIARRRERELVCPCAWPTADDVALSEFDDAPEQDIVWFDVAHPREYVGLDYDRVDLYRRGVAKMRARIERRAWLRQPEVVVILLTDDAA